MTRVNRDDSPRDALRAALREGDPAADGRGPTPDEVARLRARVLDAAHGAEAEQARLLDPPCLPESGWRWSPAAVAAALALLVIAGAVALRFEPGGRLERAGSGSPPESLGGADEAGEPEGRQIQFTTPGGTRVVWVLYPEVQDPSGRAERGSGGTS